MKMKTTMMMMMTHPFWEQVKCTYDIRLLWPPIFWDGRFRIPSVDSNGVSEKGGETGIRRRLFVSVYLRYIATELTIDSKVYTPQWRPELSVHQLQSNIFIWVHTTRRSRQACPIGC